jgi:hypothetical protein
VLPQTNPATFQPLVSTAQYPFYREEESAVVGIGIEIHVKKDPIDTNTRKSYSLYLLKDHSIESQDTPFLKMMYPLDTSFAK